MTHREASSRYVIGFSPRNLPSFILCKSTCHIALEYLRSHLAHFLFPDLVAEGETSPFSLMILYVLP